ncbi:sensor histidine kinase [Nocardia arthritidis]|uniref:sensor histidine kinase n=1 Tax=Nocardia arthritidis TaxID=228602 RepID=UPI00142E65D7|nr:sensor histidine kinase [Nocardia arthritidis]
MIIRPGIPLFGGRVFPRRSGFGNPRVVDAVVALVVFAAVSVVGACYTQPGWRPFDLLAYVICAFTCLPLAARRLAPTPTLVMTSAGYVVYLLLGYCPSLNFYAPLVAFYTVAAVARPAVTAANALLFGAVIFYSGWVAVPAVVAAAQAAATPGVVWTLAGVSRRLGLRNRQLAELTEQLRCEQRLRVEHAVAKERMQIARELHDVVAHHISVISMQAGVARYVFDSDPPTARTAVRTIGDTSRETLEELRRILHLLRAGDAPPETEIEPAPGFAGLAALIERVRGVGVDAELTVTGAVDDLPSGLQLAVYRVIQEALTNVLKHAGPCRAGVVVHRDSRQLTVTITNEGPLVAETKAANGSHGQVGMHERARLYGGTLVAGPRPEGGYQVILTVPWPLPVASTHR